MASSGTYSVTGSWARGAYRLSANWSESFSSGKHKVRITSVTITTTSSSAYHFGVAYPAGTITVNGVAAITMDKSRYLFNLPVGTDTAVLIDTNDNDTVATGSVEITGSSGALDITIAFSGNSSNGIAIYDDTGRVSPYFIGSSAVERIWNLSINAGTGSTITVRRTSSSVGGGVEDLSNGSKVYNGDTLKVSFAAQTNYELLTHTVNGTSFTSGNTHNVSGNVAVVSTARPLASTVGATDAYIGSTSTITVTKYNTNYVHSLAYSFGSLSGYIKADGTISSTEVKFTNTNVAFTVPTTFYAQIPNSSSGTCTITCRTYTSTSSTTVLGTARTCTFTATVSSSAASPTVSLTVSDGNPTTAALTGDANGRIVRYMSSAVCTITAAAQQSASLRSEKINGVELYDSSNPSQPKTLTITGNSLSNGTFTGVATDSRGISKTVTVTKTMVSYIRPTINVVGYRPSPTSGEVSITVNGNFFNASFGAVQNTLTIQYRYRKASVATWESGWLTITSPSAPSASITVSTSAYRSTAAIPLLDINGQDDQFDYQDDYVFQFVLTDGGASTPLSEVYQTIVVQAGIPVFDWGQDDFNFNVPVTIKGDTPLITIGNTSLSEAQLIRLLALLS